MWLLRGSVAVLGHLMLLSCFHGVGLGSVSFSFIDIEVCHGECLSFEQTAGVDGVILHVLRLLTVALLNAVNWTNKSNITQGKSTTILLLGLIRGLIVGWEFGVS